MNKRTKAPWVKSLEDARDIAKAAEGAARELTDDERAKISTLFAQAQDGRAKAQAQAETARQIEQVGELLKAEEAEQLNTEALNGARKGMGPQTPRSVGDRFVKSEGYQALRARFPEGIPSKADLAMAPMTVPGGMKGLLTSSGQTDGDAGTLIQPQRLGLVPYPYVAPRLREVITNGQTTSDKIEYAQVIPTADAAGTTNAAKTVKEAPATTGNVGVKPESALAFRKASAEVVTIAHWMPVTRKTLSDAAQIRTLIDAHLRQGLDEELERLILAGDKDTPKGEEEFDGILNTTGLQDQAFDTDALTTIRRAISKITRKGAQVSAILISPELDEQLDLLKDANERFYGPGPWGSGVPTIWGRPRVVVPGLSGSKKFILGDLSTCVLWDREQTTITATDSHADFFIRNLVAILAEMRAGFGILNPSLLVAGADQAE